MTVSTQFLESSEFLGDGVITELPFNFNYDSDDHVKIYQKLADGSFSEINLDHTVQRDTNNSESGNVILASALEFGLTVKLVRETDKTQLKEMSQHQAYYPSVHEGGYDKNTMLIQELCRRVFKVPSWFNGNTTFPFPFLPGQILTNDGSRLLWGELVGNVDDLTNVQIKNALWSNANVIGPIDFQNKNSVTSFGIPGQESTIHVLSNDGGFFRHVESSNYSDTGTPLCGLFISDGSASAGWERIFQGSVNTKWFGAVGDGVTDSTTEIQKTIDQGLDVYIPSGNYIVGDLNIPSNLNVSGDGWRYNGSREFIDGASLTVLDNYRGTILYKADATKNIVIGTVTSPIDSGGSFKNIGILGDGTDVTNDSVGFIINGLYFYTFSGVAIINMETAAVFNSDNNEVSWYDTGIIGCSVGFESIKHNNNDFKFYNTNFSAVNKCLNYGFAEGHRFYGGSMQGASVAMAHFDTDIGDTSEATPCVRDISIDGFWVENTSEATNSVIYRGDNVNYISLSNSRLSNAGDFLIVSGENDGNLSFTNIKTYGAFPELIFPPGSGFSTITNSPDLTLSQFEDNAGVNFYELSRRTVVCQATNDIDTVDVTVGYSVSGSVVTLSLPSITIPSTASNGLLDINGLPGVARPAATTGWIPIVVKDGTNPNEIGMCRVYANGRIQVLRTINGSGFTAVSGSTRGMNPKVITFSK